MGELLKKWKTPTGSALALTLFWIATDLLLRFVIFPAANQPFWSQLYTKSVIMTFCGALGYTVLVNLLWRFARWMAVLVAAVVAALYTIDFAVGFFTQKYFFTYVTRYHINYVAQDLRYIVDAVSTYPGLGHILLVFALFSIFLSFGFASRNWKGAWGPGKSILTIVGATAFYAVLFFRLSDDARHFVLLPNINAVHQSYLFSQDWQAALANPGERKKLGPHEKLALSPSTPLISAMKTVVLIVNESWGTDHFPVPKRGKQGMPLLASTIAAESSDYAIFYDAFTNSTATDVSWPSILTGIGPEESIERLSVSPLVSNFAARAGFKPAMFCSWRLEWGNIGPFISSGEFAKIEDVGTMGRPIVNDLGTDDLYTADRLHQYLTQEVSAEDKVFLVFASNGMHAPFQEKSANVEITDSNLTRYEKAQRIVDHSMDMVLKTLKKSGRYDESLIIITGDHGEGMFQPNPVHRIASYYDYFARIPFVVKMPKSTPEALRATFLANRTRNVQNLDIAPTLAHVFGQCAENTKNIVCGSQHGQSLFRPVEKNRILVAAGTNDVRRWVPEGFGLFRDKLRVLFSSAEPEIRAFNVENDPDQRNNIWNSVDVGTKQDFLRVIKDKRHLSRIYAAYKHDISEDLQTLTRAQAQQSVRVK